MTPPRGAGRRLTVDDWIQAGFAILADGDPSALRVDRLCERLGVTKGSFYWHFTDLAAYRTALVESWSNLQDQGRQLFENMPDVAPRERLRIMMQAVLGPQLFALERAMRVWALTDETVAESVRESDRRVLGAVHQAFIDAGFDDLDAAVRAVAFFASGMGLLHGIDLSVVDPGVGETPPEGPDLLLDFMLRP